jgi:small subunit ribosomal protein S20
LANTKQAGKRARQAVKHRAHNMAARSRMRTQIKRVLKAASGTDQQAAQAEYRAAMPIVDAMVNKKLIHRNKANRHKRRLNARIRAIGAAPRAKS